MPTQEKLTQEEQRQQPHEDLEGFSGWLILFVIGVTTTPVMLAVHFFNGALKADYSDWTTLRPDELRWAVMFAGIVYVFMAGLVAWAIRVAVLFFKKRRRFVREWKWFAVTLMAFGFAEASMDWTFQDLTVPALSTILWWAYLDISIRVRNTFVF